MALVDGNNHQIDRIEKEATARGGRFTYRGRLHPRARVPLGSSVVLLPEGDTAAEAWVHDRALAVLEGSVGRWPLASDDGQRQWDRASRRETRPDLATYLINKVEGYWDYPTSSGRRLASRQRGDRRNMSIPGGRSHGTSRVPAGASKEPRQSSGYGPCVPIMTLPSTGSSTSTANGIAFTSPATPTGVVPQAA